jgi:hypothetical protein
MGTGLVSVIDPMDEQNSPSKVKLILGEHNKPRGDQHDLIKTMSAMMSKNLCYSDENPLIAAVDPLLIDSTTLTLAYDCATSTKAGLTAVAFLPTANPAQVIILNGRQRVQAARSSYEQLSRTLEKLEEGIRKLEASQADAGDLTRGLGKRIRAQLVEAEKSKKVIQSTLKNIKFWPVRFYDRGKVSYTVKQKSHHPSDKLRSIPKETRCFPGSKEDPDVLLRFLSESTAQPQLPKGPDERLADILFKNLYKPQHVDFWKHLIGTSRVVSTICFRPRLWEMVNNVMQVSPSLLGTRVSSSSELHTNRDHPALGVSCLLCNKN